MNKENHRLETLTLYDNEEEIQTIFSCLALKVRRDIIKLVNEHPCTAQNIAEKLNIPMSTISFHVKTLLKAKILSYDTVTKRKNNEKILQLNKFFFHVNLGGRSSLFKDINLYKKTINIPIGSFSSFSAIPPCGIITKDLKFINQDMPNLFNSPERINAGIIWLKQGFLEYKIPLESIYWNNNQVEFNDMRKIRSLTFQLELCSETQHFNQNYPSDISIYVNDHKVCEILSEGDFGERLGKQNPDWLFFGNSQYGLLYSIDIRYDGTYVNEKRVSEIDVEDLDIPNNNLLTFRIEVEKDAKHVGGFNVFGKNFGDYPQDITLTINYQENK